MTSERDVIVVGAGPAGATTAVYLAQQGYDVLLLDRHQFPRDKTCGDAVPAGAIDTLNHLGMGDKIQQAVQRGELYPLESMRLVSPKGYELEAMFHKGPGGNDSYVAPRQYFDVLIQQHAIDSGAKFRQAQATAPLLENGRVVGVKVKENGRIQELHSKVVVGADGVTSVITRTLRPKENQHTDGHRAVALRAYIEGLKEFPHQVEFYLYNQILPGYAWIFPTAQNRANIGLGMRLDHFRAKKQSLEEMLDTFLAMPAIKKRLQPGWKLHDMATWQLNFGSQQHLQHVYDSAILVGDAAGLINPLTGGGIHNAIISAKLAARTVHEALQRNDTSRSSMQIYEQRIHEAIWGSMKRSYQFQRSLMRFPMLIDFLVKRMKENSGLAKMFLTKL
ncbi:MAG: NAD(P)/FAD-dependent oxidoreductase [Ardenticatenaceae bacterium]|nr:NAD(P)/FAD-dependent oxidoreductase [Ardenticatenaceae bacterium]MCB9445447.1 NAD(P)/FAD-dependent oxidoreductase [Ardenticatenaceae bacterium]